MTTYRNQHLYNVYRPIFHELPKRSGDTYHEFGVEMRVMHCVQATSEKDAIELEKRCGNPTPIVKRA